jgi:hypothetical protein
MPRTTTLPPQLTIQEHARPLTGSTQDYAREDTEAPQAFDQEGQWNAR